MGVKKKGKKLLKGAFFTYLGLYLTYSCAYLGSAGYAFYDHFKYNVERVKKKAENHLLVKNYDISLGNKVKRLTLVGEIHMYNYKESEFGKKLIQNYKHVAHEGGTYEGRSAFIWAWSALGTPSNLFYMMGSGRYHPSIGVSAVLEGKEIHFLESGEDSFEQNTTLEQKLMLMSSTVTAFATAPLSYYIGRNMLINGEDWDSIIKDLDGNSSIGYAVNLTERDTIMADNIAELLEKDNIDSLLCVMGRGHIVGVEKNLKEKLKLEEANF